MRRLIVGISGATGSIYGIRILEVLSRVNDIETHLVLTKADKIKPTELASRIEAIRAEAAKHPAAHPLIIPTSSETGDGIADLRTAILDAARA